jgi:cyanophycin synthetase
MTCTDGIYIGRRQISTRDCSGPQSARAVLLNPEVEVGVFETARGGILREGLGFDRCDVAVVTNIGQGDHLGLRGVETLEQLARVKRTVVDVVGKDGTAVLNASDRLVVEMAECWFSRDSQTPALCEGLAAGGRAVFVRDGMIVLAEGSHQRSLLTLAQVPATHGGAVGFQVENVLAATAALWSLGIPEDGISDALRSFTGDARQLPGRFNVLTANDATIIVDYAHNASALQAVIEALPAFPHARRTLVFGAFDRRDEEVVEIGRLLGSSFDRIILFGDVDHRDRHNGELTRLLRQGIGSASHAVDLVEAETEQAAVQTALDALRPDDLVVIGTEEIARSVALAETFAGRQPLPSADGHRPAEAAAPLATTR